MSRMWLPLIYCNFHNTITHLGAHMLLLDFLLRLLDSLTTGLVQAELTELHRVVPGTNVCVGGLADD